MTDSNLLQVVIAEEAAFGLGSDLVTVGAKSTDPSMIFPVSGQSLRQLVTYQPDPTIRADRNIVDSVRVTLSAGGALPFAPRFDASAALWTVLKRTLQNDPSTAGSCTSAGSTTTINDSTKSFSGTLVGQTVRLYSGASAAIGTSIVTVASGTTLTFAPALRAATATGNVYNMTNITENTQVTGITFTAGGANTLTGAGVGTGVEVGDYVRVLKGTALWDGNIGGTNSGPPVGYFRVNTVTSSSSITIDPLAATMVADSALIVKRGQRIKNGKTSRSFTIEIGRLDPVTPIFERWVGMQPDNYTLTITDGQITAASVQFVGSKSLGATTPGAGNTGFFTSPTAAPTGSVFGPVTSIPTILTGGAVFPLQSFSSSLSNGSAPRTQIGALGPQSVRSGRANVTGTFRGYFNGIVEYNKFTNDTASGIVYAMTDGVGTWVTAIPRLKYSSGNHDTAGPDQDEVLELPLQGLLSSQGGGNETIPGYTFASATT